MIPDIGKIVASYTTPYCLRNLFIQYNLDFNMPFMYDASCDPIEFVNIFKCFPKIILTGLAIESSKDITITDIITHIGLQPLKKLIIIYIGQMLKYDMLKLNIQNISQYSDLNFFRVRHYDIINTNALVQCPNITYLDLKTCTHEQIPSKTFKKLFFCGYNQSYWHPQVDLNKYSNLQHLNSNHPVKLTTFCPTIKSVGFDEYFVPDLTIYPNLEFICMRFSSDLKKYTELRWSHLKHIIIKCCNIDAKFFDDCPNLITIELYDCLNVYNINNLINRPNINLIINTFNIETFKYGPNKSYRKYMKLYDNWINYRIKN